MSIVADRRLCLTADRSEVVEEGDMRAAWLFVGVGRVISPSDAERYGLKVRDGLVVLSGVEPEKKQAAQPANKMADEPENKAAAKPSPKKASVKKPRKRKK